jgi:hypothetical protein
MKKKGKHQKLKLDKIVITVLNKTQQSKILGGYPTQQGGGSGGGQETVDVKG